jgi:hypothetical protein
VTSASLPSFSKSSESIMSKLRRCLSAGLVLVTACAVESTTPEADVATVTLSPASPTVRVGATVQLSAQAFDASGTPLSERQVSWGSGAASIATVDGTGLATGVSAGSVEISATVDGITASDTLLVQPEACTSSTSVALSPGEHMTVSGDTCLLLPSGSAGDLYRIAVGRPTLFSNANNTAEVTLAISPVGLVAAPPLADASRTAASTAQAAGPSAAFVRDEAPRIEAPHLLEHLRMQGATRRFHDELRLRERALGLPSAALLPDLSPTAAAAGGPALLPPASEDSLYLDLTCAPAEPQPVRLIDFSNDLAIYQETAEWETDPISLSATADLIAYYEAYVLDMVEAYWGRLPDIDSNGRLVVVTSPELGEDVSAAVFSGDFFQRGPDCESSNEGEYMYFSGDVLRALDDDDAFALGVLAHEAKHVVSLYNSIERGSMNGGGPPSFNELWIEEGTAEVSQIMSSRIAWEDIGGPAPNEPVTAQALRDTYQANGETIPPEMSAIVDQLAGITYALSAQPNSFITDPSGAPDEHSFYSSSWHWHRWLGDAFGNASDAPLADSTFFRTLTDPSTPAGGASGEIQLTGRTFDQLFEDFVVAVSFQGTPYSPTDAFDTWDFFSGTAIFTRPNPTGDYPWPVTAEETQSSQGATESVTQWAPFASGLYEGRVGPSGIRFHDFRSSGTASAEIQVSGLSGFQEGLVVVSRLD